MDVHAAYKVFMDRFRPRRAEAIRRLFPELAAARTRVVDVGGTALWWRDYMKTAAQVTVVNIDPPVATDGVVWAVADGRHLPFASQSFDLAFSNSVIEHVGDLEAQRAFAREIVRCGRSVCVQTPNRWFPIEPHLLGVGIHWVPLRARRRLVRYFTGWGLITKPSQAEIDAALADIRLLSAREMRSLFPGCELRAERALGLRKSLTAVQVRM